MRCLGIPNTAHFANITSIEEALELWRKIKNNKDEERWKPETEVRLTFDERRKIFTVDRLNGNFVLFAGRIRRFDGKRGQQEDLRRSSKTRTPVNLLLE